MRIFVVLVLLIIAFMFFFGIEPFRSEGLSMFANPFSMVVGIVAISVLGGVLRELVKQRKDFSTGSQKELNEIRQHIAQIEADIADIKEQIADFIIKTS